MVISKELVRCAVPYAAAEPSCPGGPSLPRAVLPWMPVRYTVLKVRVVQVVLSQRDWQRASVRSSLTSLQFPDLSSERIDI